MDEIILEANEKMDKTIENLLERFKTIRAGRANPAILDGVKVEYYGTPTPLNQLATVSVPEARRLQIKPFDKSCLANIEKAIFEADLGLTPNNTGELIFIAIPELTEDRRREFVKQAKTLAEEAKIALRNIRQDANNAIKKDEEINEDMEKSLMNEVQDLINDFNKKVDEKLKEKEILAQEIRKYILDIVSKNGGHLASNLGVVELTIALNVVFDIPTDKVVWDVGHQTYVHKIINGRKEELKKIRTLGGIAGFPKTNESETDCFNTGHSSTSISAALGMARARDIKGNDNSVIAVIGDRSSNRRNGFRSIK